ncbi:MAG TPA: hypothetical protein VFN18_01845 [Solirubrobacterales bacterium]|nr:hypothetical protein [Solirubrobacterales bacterium]
MVNAHSGWFTLIVAASIIVLVNLLLVGVFHEHLGLGAELGLEAMIVFVGIAIPVGLTLATLWPEMRVIVSIVSGAPSKATPILLRFVSEELQLLSDRIADTRTRGIDLEGRVVSSWVRDRCFAVASGPYVATDSLVPSDFLSRYSSYLVSHKKYIERTGCRNSVRINMAPADDLRLDAEMNEADLRLFQGWHDENNVELLYLSREKAQAIADEVGLENTLDVAIWEGEMALLFDYANSPTTKMRLALVDETSYRRCTAFFAAVREAAVPFSSLFSEDPDWPEEGRPSLPRM